METNQDLFRLGQIRDCIDKILELTKILHDLNNFESKWIEQDTLIRNFEIIGEASMHISEETKLKYPDVAWN